MELLKQDLKQMIHRIIEEEDFDSSTADKAIEKLSALKILKMAGPASPTSPTFSIPSSPESSGTTGSNAPTVPENFRCPISGELMKDPVLLITGQTYDRFFIEKWFHKGHNTCPRTKEVLSDLILTPNRLLRSMILQWCLDNKLEIPKLSYEKVFDNATKSHLDELLNKLMSSSLTDKKEAAKELRETSRWSHEFRALFTKLPKSIERLLHPLSVDKVNLHPDLQEDLITTILNISIYDDNKKHLVENSLVLPLLIQSLQYGNIETIANAAAAIYSLSFNEVNKIMIGNYAGVFKHLIVLLDYGHPVVVRDAAVAIYNLCTAVENREKAVCSEAVTSILRNINQSVLMDELISILALLSTDRKAIDELCNLNAVHCMLRIIRITEAQRIKENCASILFAMCTTDQSQLKKIQGDEKAKGTILELSQTGNSRARRKATGILDRLHRSASRTHTA